MEEDFKKLLPAEFDYEAFQMEAIEELKTDKPLSGERWGVDTPYQSDRWSSTQKVK